MSTKIDVNTPTFKKQAISLLIVAGLLVGAWYAYGAVTALIFQSNKYGRQDSIENPNLDNVDLTQVIPLPPGYSLDLSDFNFSMETLMDLLSLLGGDPTALNDLLSNLSPEELNFRLFDVYPDAGSDVDFFDFWRTTACDQYSGVGSEWSHSDAATSTVSEISNREDYTESFEIVFGFGQTSSTSLAIPTAYSSPYIESGSVSGNNINSYTLDEDMDEGVLCTFSVDPATDGNLTYGIGKEDVPNDSWLQAESWTIYDVPQNIRDVYLQFPGAGSADYLNNNPKFQEAFNNLSLSVTATDSIYERADIIRTYLANNFELADPDGEEGLIRPDDNEDQVEWFLTEGSGLPHDFAAAFVMLARAYEVPCRFATGYNSLLGNDMGSYYEVTLGCMYAWNEVYIPTNFGSDFYPLIVLHDGLPGGLVPDDAFDPSEIGEHGTINIQVDNDYLGEAVGPRYDTFDLIMELNLTEGQDNASQYIEIYDYTEEVTVDTVQTDANGYAYYTLTFDDSYTAGAHFLGFEYSPLVQNATVAVLLDQMSVVLDDVSPTSVDVNPKLDLADTQVRAHIYDTHNSNPIKSARLQPVVVESGSAISQSVYPEYVTVDNTGFIDELVTINGSYVTSGSYEFRVDFNGTYELEHPITGEPVEYSLPPMYSLFGFSSNTEPFTIINTDDLLFNLEINGFEAGESDIVRTRGQTLAIDLYLENQSNPVIGGSVDFYDNTFGGSPFLSVSTNALGQYTGVYTIPSSSPWVAGPHEIYAKWTESDRINGSWWILINEPVALTMTLSSTVINRTGTLDNTLTVSGTVTDVGISQPVPNCVVSQTVSRLFTDYTSILDDEAPASVTDSSGNYQKIYDIDDTASLGSYDMTSSVTGNFYLDDLYTIPGFTLETEGPTSFIVQDPNLIDLRFTIDGTETQSDYYGSTAPSYVRSDSVMFSVDLYISNINAGSGKEIIFFDETTGHELGRRTTSATGSVNLLFSLSDSRIAAGLNLISVQYAGKDSKNYTQIYVHDTAAEIEIKFISNPADTPDYTRAVDLVTVSGYIEDRYNNRIKNAEVRLVIETQTGVDVTSQIVEWVNSGNDVLYTSDLNGQFEFQFRFPISMHGEFDMHIEFTGNIRDESTSCPAEYTIGTMGEDSADMEDVTAWAGVTLSANYYPSSVLMGEPITVYGELHYDNGTLISGTPSVNITFTTATGELCEVDSFEMATCAGGVYNESVTMIWDDCESIYVEYAGDNLLFIESVRAPAAYNPP